MKRTVLSYVENAGLLAVGFMVGTWFQRNPVDGLTTVYYVLAAVAIISARLAVISYRNRAESSISA